jgi:5-methyltetrahydropteroyltriglutamate--homocysteine methyltransferase
MITNNLGYPRIGRSRELKKASESFWSGKISVDELEQTAAKIKLDNWKLQKDSGIDLIPSNDFSFYDHVLDMAVTLGAIPVRFKCLQNYLRNEKQEFYFSLARGYQKEGFDITAMEMTKWFDTNYHYIVPEFTEKQRFEYSSSKVKDDFTEAKNAGIITKPVILGPVSFLLLGKVKEGEFDKSDLMPDLLPVYFDLIHDLIVNGVEWLQIDEPMLCMDLNDKTRELYRTVYNEIRSEFPKLKIILATYFGSLGDNEQIVAGLPVDAVHLDLVRSPGQMNTFLEIIPDGLMLSLGLVDGRNIWKNDFAESLRFITDAIEKIGEDRIMIAPSCSLIHSPIDLEMENDESTLPVEIRGWMSFARQKLAEVSKLKELAARKPGQVSDDLSLYYNQESHAARKSSGLTRNDAVRERLASISEIENLRRSDFRNRKIKQQKILNLPMFPSTTIGSFPQTNEVRNWRSKFKKGELSAEEYRDLLRKEIEYCIRWQEEAGLDVLVHGEFERNDMVEYFGEKLKGFVFMKNGWIQSYGSRYVKPPVIYGDVYRPQPMTLQWIGFAQSLTGKPVKGMLTGPVTMLQWSFVRNDQPRSETCLQIALALRDEVIDLEKAGIKIIQIDEPALREGLPLHKADRPNYLEWAVRAFRLTYSGVKDQTQIHTHMCYSEFNDIIESIAALDADVITIECSRSQMELLDAFAEFRYPNDIGPGVYDIHSPRIPSENEIIELLSKAVKVIPEDQIWVNPDCGLKTRTWDETKKALVNMVRAARMMKEKYVVPAR